MQDHKLKIMNDSHIEWVLIEQMKSKENPREAESKFRFCAKTESEVTQKLAFRSCLYGLQKPESDKPRSTIRSVWKKSGVEKEKS